MSLGPTVTRLKLDGPQKQKVLGQHQLSDQPSAAQHELVVGLVGIRRLPYLQLGWYISAPAQNVVAPAHWAGTSPASRYTRSLWYQPSKQVNPLTVVPAQETGIPSH
jgi:hypothetical protein